VNSFTGIKPPFLQFEREELALIWWDSRHSFGVCFAQQEGRSLRRKLLSLLLECEVVAEAWWSDSGLSRGNLFSDGCKHSYRISRPSMTLVITLAMTTVARIIAAATRARY